MMATLRRFHNSGLAGQLVRLIINDCFVNSNLHLQVYERLFADLIIQLEGFHYIIGVATRPKHMSKLQFDKNIVCYADPPPPCFSENVQSFFCGFP